MTPELKRLLDTCALAAEYVFAKNGLMRPMWHAVTEKNEHLIFDSPSENRDHAVALVRALFVARNVIRYVFMDEAWMLEALNDPQKVADLDKWTTGTVSLSEHPERVEIVLFSAEDYASGQVLAHRKIVRHSIGPATLRPLEVQDVDGGTHEGRLVGLLPVQGMKQ